MRSCEPTPAAASALAIFIERSYSCDQDWVRSPSTSAVLLPMVWLCVRTTEPNDVMLFPMGLKPSKGLDSAQGVPHKRSPQ